MLSSERLNNRPEIKFETSLISFAEQNNERVLSALFVATQVHEGDRRKISGEPYIYHCVAVANTLKKWGAGEDEVVAGLLHDSFEDHPDIISLEDIEKFFGERVAFLVDGVTKLKSRQGDKNEFETLRKVTRGSLIEPGVALIKLADRLHNMSTMEGMNPVVQKIKAKETIAVYGPLAESFGLWQVKNALQDYAFHYLYPETYGAIRKIIDQDPRINHEFIERRELEIAEELRGRGIAATVEHQVGGYWELWDKQKKAGIRAGSRPKSFEDITDVVSIRVIVPDENIGDVYQAMGVMRFRYKNQLDKARHDDYIVNPASNGYSALHDTYRFPEGNLEIAFTTATREKFNNWGVLSLSDEELRNNREKYQRKLIFTPKEELVFMEPGATGIDVAYKLSATLGIKASGIIIDGRLSDLSTVVPNVGLVEIVTDVTQEKPRTEWLNYCNDETKRMIEQQLIVIDHDSEVNKGKSILAASVLKDRGLLNLDDFGHEILSNLLLDLGCWYGLPDLYYKIANGLDLGLVKKGLDEIGIPEGLYSTVQVIGSNHIGVSSEIAEIVAKNGGDTRIKIERVNKEERFLVRVVMTVSQEGKRKIKEEIENKFGDCVVI